MAKELAQNSFKGAVFEYHKHSGEIVVPAVSLPDKAHGGAPSSGDIGKICGILRFVLRRDLQLLLS